MKTILGWLWDRKWWIIAIALALELWFNESFFDSIITKFTHKLEHADSTTQKARERLKKLSKEGKELVKPK